MNGNGYDIVGGANAIGEAYVAATKNRYDAENKAMLFASGYFILPPKNYFLQSDFTITVWVKISSVPTSTMLFDFSNGIDADNVMLSISTLTTTTPTAWIFNAAAQNNITSTTILYYNVWQHLAFVYESNTMYIYRDGTIIATRAFTHQPRSVVRAKGLIGKCNYLGYQSFIGVMDDLRIYHKALATYEIMQVMKEDD